MKSRKIRSIVAVFLFAALAFSLSSCNRGLGCPSNFSVKTVVNKTVDVAPAIISAVNE